MIQGSGRCAKFLIYTRLDYGFARPASPLLRHGRDRQRTGHDPCRHAYSIKDKTVVDCLKGAIESRFSVTPLAIATILSSGHNPMISIIDIIEPISSMFAKGSLPYISIILVWIMIVVLFCSALAGLLLSAVIIIIWTSFKRLFHIVTGHDFRFTPQDASIISYILAGIIICIYVFMSYHAIQTGQITPLRRGPSRPPIFWRSDRVGFILAFGQTAALLTGLWGSITSLLTKAANRSTHVSKNESPAR